MIKHFCCFSVLAFTASLCVSITVGAQSITTPRTASPAAKISQTIGLSTVTVSYSRPSVRGREIWGKLVPYGLTVQSFGANREAPWRAGANENTVIEFSDPVSVEGRPVPAGSYGMFFVINKDNSGELILSKEYRSWGSFWYDPAQDMLRVPVQIGDITHTEILTYEFTDLDKSSALLVLRWEKKQFPVRLRFAVDDLVMANAVEELKGPAGFSWQGYSSAANYALQNKVNTEQALTWIDKAIGQRRSFNTLIVKSGLLLESGKEAEAEAIRKEALGLATEAELNIHGYQLLGQVKYDQAIEIFKLNTERFPKSPNAWDSLGEGYAAKGDQKNAISSFKKSLGMNPPENVRANSEKFLKQLGAM